MKHKYHTQAHDPVFSEDNWNNIYYPLIEEKINKRFAEVPQSLIESIEAIGDIKINKKWFLLFNFAKQKQTKSNEELIRSLKLRAQVIEAINAPQLVNDIISNDFKYYECGPITQELLEAYPTLKQFDWKCDLSQNNYTSSWGIFRNHIIINNAKQFLIQMSEGRSVVYKIITQRDPILFTNVLPELNFYMKNLKGQTKKKIFENQTFLEKYNWVWNNDTWIMMYFTPWFQEQFIQVNNKSICEEYNIRKQGNFISSIYKQIYATSTFNTKEVDHQYLSINDVNTNEYFKLLKKAIIEFLHDKYKALAFATIIPIIDSEYESNFIDNFIKKGKVIKASDNANNIVNYLIHEHRLCDINPFTVIDNYDMYTSSQAVIYTTPDKNNFFIAPVDRIRCYCQFNMSESGEFENKYGQELLLNAKQNIKVNNSLTKAMSPMGHLIYAQVGQSIKYTNSNFYHFSNLDEVNTFKLNLVIDELKHEYQCSQVVINHGFISFIINQPYFDETYIDRIQSILKQAKEVQ